MTQAFGTIISRYQVEQAVINLLQGPPPGTTSAALIVYYLAEVERQNGLAPQTLPIPPGPNSYRGGTDGSTLMAEWFPMLTVVAQPSGKATYLDRYTITQGYSIKVLATVGNDSEDTSRMIADHYGAAVAKALVDFGSLGGIATNTRLVDSPSVAPLDPQARQVMRSSVSFETWIAPVFTVQSPETWPASPYTTPAGWPTVDTVDVTVTAADPTS